MTAMLVWDPVMMAVAVAVQHGAVSERGKVLVQEHVPKIKASRPPRLSIELHP